MGKYGKIWTEKKEIPEDEPVFLLRGKDSLAALSVEHYAGSLEQQAARATNDDDRKRFLRAADEVRKIAEAMRNYSPRRLPD